MKNLLRLFVLLAAMPALGGLADARAQQEGAVVLKIAVMDVDAIRRDAKAVKAMQEQIGKYRSKYESEFKKEEEALRAANQDLAKKRTILSPEAFAEERRKFERRVVDVQRLVQVRKQDLDKVRGVAMSKIQEVLNGIIADMVKEQSLTLILSRSQTVTFSRQIDITKTILERLNAKLPTVTVPEPGK